MILSFKYVAKKPLEVMHYLVVLTVQTMQTVNDVLLAKMDVSMQRVCLLKEKLVVRPAGSLVGE